MIEEVKYCGVYSNPTDYECKDGNLALSLNAVPEDGSLRPVLAPSVILSLSDEEVVKYIHTTSKYKHYIIFDSENNIKYVDDEDRATVIDTGFNVEDPISVNGIGNTIVILTKTGMEYYLWKEEKYSYLGNHLPEIQLSFGLQGHVVRTEEFEVPWIKEDTDGTDSTYDSGEEEEPDEDELEDGFTWNTTEATSYVLAKTNKLIAEQSTDKGRFIFPFFVRYAYKLYDGTYTMQSAPILMLAADKCAPVLRHQRLTLCYKKKSGSDNNYYYIRPFYAHVFGVFYDLDYLTIGKDKLDRWDDIISSVDIFISAPIYTYDQNEELDVTAYCWHALKGKNIDLPNCVCRHMNSKSSIDTIYTQYYQLWNYDRLYANTFTYEGGVELGDYYGYWSNYRYRIAIPAKSDEDITNDIKDNANFYLLKSVELDDLATERTKIDIEDDYLQSLLTRQTLSDDYDSHDTLIPNLSFAYNSRINIANINKILYDGYPATALYQYSDGYVLFGDDAVLTENNKTCTGITIAVKIVQDQQEIIVKSSVSSKEGLSMAYNHPITWFYYPNTNAKEVTFDIKWSEKVSDNLYSIKHQIYTAKLTSHDFLNGAYWFGNWDDLMAMVTESNTDTIPTASSNKTVYLNNKIYTSDVNNPFYFPLSGINTVGTGTIIGVSSATKALSQGQFGQFPLYAFTTDGIWALEVSSTGSYSAKQPVSRDVCTNSESITQLDSSVLFVTDRGIMHIEGSITDCISNVLMSDNPAHISMLPNADKVIAYYNQDSSTNGGAEVSVSNIDLLPFKDFLKDCLMVYDYVNQRIIVYNNTLSVNYAYVYSMKSREWGMMFSNFISGVNGYPDALVMNSNHELVNLSLPTDNKTTALIMTRPFRLKRTDVFKTIKAIVQRGFFDESKIKQVLYASNDLFNWVPVWSHQGSYMRGFHGSPYRAYRLVLIVTLEKDHALYGFSTDFEERLTNRLR